VISSEVIFSTSQVFSVYYPWIDISGFAPGVLSVHPTQLYEFSAAVAIFYFLWSRRNNVKIAGSLFFSYLILAGVERFTIEFIRTNEKYLFDLFSGSQVISVFMILIGTYFLLNPISKHDPDSA
jgi:prolipoprotein diacylglyceryltransferase